MFDPDSPKSRKKAVLFAVCLALAAGIFLSGLFAGRIAITTIHNLTGYELSYDKWRLSPLRGIFVSGLRLDVADRNLVLNAEKGTFRLKLRQSLAERSLVVDCSMTGITFSPEGSVTKGAAQDSGDILSVVVNPLNRYRELVFSVSLGREILAVRGLQMDSSDVRIRGEAVYEKARENIALKLQISFSPALYATFPQEIRKRGLSPDDDGWYGTVVDYRGNPILLRALYSLTGSM